MSYHLAIEDSQFVTYATKFACIILFVYTTYILFSSNCPPWCGKAHWHPYLFLQRRSFHLACFSGESINNLALFHLSWLRAIFGMASFVFF